MFFNRRSNYQVSGSPLLRTRGHVRARKINNYKFLSQLTNIKYQSPTVNRSANGFTDVLQDEIFFHEADMGNQWAAGFFRLVKL
jgi:hypothetical protein